MEVLGITSYSALSSYCVAAGTSTTTSTATLIAPSVTTGLGSSLLAGSKVIIAFISSHPTVLLVGLVGLAILFAYKMHRAEGQQASGVSRPNEQAAAISQSVQKSSALKAFSKNSTLPYFLHRQGFPNPSARNCPYNSLSVIYAHTRYVIDLTIHPNNQQLFQELQAQHAEDFKALLNQRIQEAEITLQDKTTQLAAQQQQEDQQRNEIEQRQTAQVQELQLEYEQILKAEGAQNLAISLKIQEHKDAIEGLKKNPKPTPSLQQIALAHHEASLVGLSDRLKKPTEKSQAVLAKLRQKKTELLGAQKAKKNNIKHPLQTEIENLENRLSVLRGALEQQQELERSKEVLAILRGEKQGALTERDAQILCEVLPLPRQHNVLYGGSPEAVAKDIGQSRLQAALNDPNWRVLRVGGHGHWWTYVRNPDETTVDMINDATVNRAYRSNQDLFDYFRHSENWREQQITFY